MTSLYAEFKMPSSSGLRDIAMKPKAKYILCSRHLFYIPQRNYLKSFFSLLPYTIPGPYIKCDF
jgi:hypothetical protein